METVFIYTLNCPITGNVRYVGKTKNPAKRFWTHLYRSQEKDHKNNWIRSLQLCGLEPEMVILSGIPDEGWETIEREWISLFKFTGFDLTNATDGGEGVTMTPEIRAKIGISGIGRKPWNLGKKHSMVSILKMRIAQANKRGPNLGKKFSPEHCAALSMAHLGEKHSPERCAKKSISMIGNKRSLGRKPWNFGKKKDKINGWS